MHDPTLFSVQQMCLHTESFIMEHDDVILILSSDQQEVHPIPIYKDQHPKFIPERKKCGNAKDVTVDYDHGNIRNNLNSLNISFHSLKIRFLANPTHATYISSGVTQIQFPWKESDFVPIRNAILSRKIGYRSKLLAFSRYVFSLLYWILFSGIN